jgi:ABC-type multidrug transport system ATPase subunit
MPFGFFLFSKTTLIKTLALDAFYGRSTGSLSLGDCKVSQRVFKHLCFVVEQHDINWGYLTCRETMTYAAELYDVAKKKSDIPVLVNDILDKMGLDSCADTRSNNLSGGQQRRLSLSIGLVKQPTVLFLDEPTSGLDAASASGIMTEITSVAKSEDLIIICTIHQPSSKVFSKFDQLMILSKGREAFVGDVREAVPYFRQLGDPVPPLVNPAEHFLDVFNADFSSDELVDAKLDAWECYQAENRLVAPVSHCVKESDLLPPDEGRFINDIPVLLRRHAVLIARDPIMYIGRCAVFLIVNTFFGVVYLKAKDHDQDQAANKLWVLNWYAGVPANLGVVTVYYLNEELKTIFRENKNGMVSVSSYMLVKTLLAFPFVFVFALFALILPLYIIQDASWSTFFPIFFLWAAFIFVWEAIGEAIAAIVDNPIFGMLAYVSCWFLALLFSGFLVPPQDLQWPLRAFHYFFPWGYWTRSACFVTFSETYWTPCTDPTSSAVCVNSTNGIDVLDSFNRVFPLVTSEDTYYQDLGAMVCIGLFWKLLAVSAVLVKSRREASFQQQPTKVIGAPSLTKLEANTDPRLSSKGLSPTASLSAVSGNAEVTVLIENEKGTTQDTLEARNRENGKKNLAKKKDKNLAKKKGKKGTEGENTGAEQKTLKKGRAKKKKPRSADNEKEEYRDKVENEGGTTDKPKKQKMRRSVEASGTTDKEKEQKMRRSVEADGTNDERKESKRRSVKNKEAQLDTNENNEAEITCNEEDETEAGKVTE